MPFDPARHHRRSTRLRGYDYSGAGIYFVTLCTLSRECLFGDITDASMQPSKAGEIVQEEWLRSATIRSEIALDAMVVMPNHLHGIVIIQGVGATGGSPAEADPLQPADQPSPPATATAHAANYHPYLRDVRATGGSPTEADPSQPADQPSPPATATAHAANYHPCLRDVGATGRSPTEAASPQPERKADRDACLRDVGATGRSPLQPGPAKRSLGALIAGFKAATTKRINAWRGTPGNPVWQRNYYDRIIRDEDELWRIREYIANNPAQWAVDRENPLVVAQRAPSRPKT